MKLLTLLLPGCFLVKISLRATVFLKIHFFVTILGGVVEEDIAIKKWDGKIDCPPPLPSGKIRVNLHW